MIKKYRRRWTLSKYYFIHAKKIKRMKKIITLAIILLQIMIGYAQENSTTDIYTKTIDTILEQSEFNIDEDVALILAPPFYKNNIKTYKGNHTIRYISGFGDNQKEWSGKKFLYLNLSPIMLSKGDLMVMVKRSIVRYKSKKKWKLNQEDQQFFYTCLLYTSDAADE